ncbi:MAG: hypothetical protein IPF66_22965 [Holophagales bacterium]|nr:hypothetical protein [Holophagales bacterium]
MRKALSVLAALALTLSTGVASAHDGHAHGKEAILGTVAQVHGDHLEVADPDGKTVSVTLTSATTYLRGDSEAKKADLKPGVRVAVETADGKSGLEARIIRIGAEEKAVWTCPMHPEVKNAGPGKCPKCGMFLEKKKA